MELSYYRKKIDVLSASGKDVIDFLNRMSTNDVINIQVNEFRKTFLTSDKGRIIDLITILNCENEILLITTFGYSDKVLQHLNKYIIMDDVNLQKINESYYLIQIFGSNLSETLNNVFEVDIEDENQIIEKNNIIYFIDKRHTNSFNIFVNDLNIESVNAKLKALKELNETEYNLLRIDKSIPEGPNEFQENINPKECGLEDFISYTKGCYIGQEVVARLDAQGKIPKQMIKFETNVSSTLDEGDKIYTEDSNKECGFITSIAQNNGSAIGLGFIRSVNLDFEKEYIIRKDSSESDIKLKIKKTFQN